MSQMCASLFCGELLNPDEAVSLHGALVHPDCHPETPAPAVPDQTAGAVPHQRAAA